MSATYDEIIAVWKKVAQGAIPGYTCYLSGNKVLKKLSDVYNMLKRAKDPKPAAKHQEKITYMCVDNFLTYMYQKRILISIIVPKSISLFKIRKDPAKVLLEVKTSNQSIKTTLKEELIENIRSLARTAEENSRYFSPFFKC